MRPPFYDNANKIGPLEMGKLLDALRTIDDKNRSILSHLVLKGPEDGTVKSLDDVADRVGIRVPAVRVRLTALIAAGLIETATYRHKEKTRPSTVYRPALPDLSAVVVKDKEQTGLKVLPESHEIHVMSRDIGSVMNGEGNYFVDNLFGTTLFTALPHSRKLCTKPLAVNVRWFGHTIPVTLRPYHGKAIAKGEDVRFYVGLITYLTELVRREGIPQAVAEGSNWTVPLGDILKCLGLPLEGGHYKTAIDAFNRLGSTRIEIYDLPEAVKTRHGFEEVMQTFQPLTNIGIYKTSGKKKSTYLSFSLPPSIQSELTVYGEGFFPLSVNALRYNEAYMLRVHLWAKRRMGAKFNSVDVSQNKAHMEINPGADYKEHIKMLEKTLLDFARCYESEMERGVIETHQYRKLVLDEAVFDEAGRLISLAVNLFGYVVRYTRSHLYLTRDPSDPIAGPLGRNRKKLDMHREEQLSLIE